MSSDPIAKLRELADLFREMSEAEEPPTEEGLARVGPRINALCDEIVADKGAAVLAEREACVAIAEAVHEHGWLEPSKATGARIAGDIRARK